ncbi:MAG: InlB B-repeat-containing protein [Clostridia bacterium]|nr:InlB B-repeat-containing protein [Clostridia bacterium]
MKQCARRLTAGLLCLLMIVSVAAAGGVLRVSAITQTDAAAWAKAQGDRRVGFDLDAHYGYQCSDFVTAYMNYLVDGDAYSGRYQVYDAKEYPDVAAEEPARWTVLRGAEMVPQPGDIFVAAGRDQSFGHAGIIVGQAGKKYKVVDQNSYPKIDYVNGQPCYTHDISLTNDYALTALIRYRFDVQLFTLTYHANGGENAPAAQTGSGTVQLSGAAPTKEGYDFLGWAESAGASSAQYQPGASVNLTADLTLFAVWQLHQSGTQEENPTANAVLHVRDSATVEYRADVTLTATATGVPQGYVLAIYEGGTQRAVGSNETVSYHIGSMTGSRTLTVRVTNAAGAVQKDGSGAELSKTAEIKVSDSFFLRLIAFIKGLFGLLPKVEILP